MAHLILLGFDQVFLDMVESIVTDQDREDVIIELQSFIVCSPPLAQGTTYMSNSMLLGRGPRKIGRNVTGLLRS